MSNKSGSDPSVIENSASWGDRTAAWLRSILFNKRGSASRPLLFFAVAAADYLSVIAAWPIAHFLLGEERGASGLALLGTALVAVLTIAALAVELHDPITQEIRASSFQSLDRGFRSDARPCGGPVFLWRLPRRSAGNLCLDGSLGAAPVFRPSSCASRRAAIDTIGRSRPPHGHRWRRKRRGGIDCAPQFRSRQSHANSRHFR